MEGSSGERPFSSADAIERRAVFSARLRSAAIMVYEREASCTSAGEPPLTPPVPRIASARSTPADAAGVGSPEAPSGADVPRPGPASASASADARLDDEAPSFPGLVVVWAGCLRAGMAMGEFDDRRR